MSSYILALDIGLKRTGVALAQKGLNSTDTKASPLASIEVKNGHPDFAHLDKLHEQWQPEVYVIGNPQTDNPHLNKAINRFKHHIQSQYKCAIEDVSEFLTTEMANLEMRDYERVNASNLSLDATN